MKEDIYGGEKQERRSCTTTQSPPNPDDHDLSKMCSNFLYTNLHHKHKIGKNWQGKKKKRKNKKEG